MRTTQTTLRYPKAKLEKQEGEQERSKGFPVRNDNPKPEELGPINTNPPTPTIQ
ncbi:MAG: hypothetical protein HC903_29850 [Methylacidiphilales bacterium]|nr:hypothetical protein [Candidatus Methylacidiphilales bacterium]